MSQAKINIWEGITVRILPLEINRKQEFIDYCVTHRSEHDASNLYDEDLKCFIPNENNPTYILNDNNDTVVGAVSLLLDPESRKKGASRFRILHSTITTIEAYQMMIDAISNHLDGINNIFLYIPEEKTCTRDILEKLGFCVQRFAWILTRKNENILLPNFPNDYIVKPLRKGKDEEAWCNISNAAFSIFNWHVNITTESVLLDETSDTYIKDGILMLWHGKEPIGILRVEKDPDDNILEIGPIAILPAYQGKGLGRNLLRFGLEVGLRNGFKSTVLSVNGENKKAADLYLSEGFEKKTLIYCYEKSLLTNTK